MSPEFIIYSFFGSLIVINLIMFYVLYISKKYYSLMKVSSALWNLVKNMQKSDPISLRAEIQSLEKEPKEILEAMLYGRN